MARRKKTKKHRTHHRRRMGAIHTGGMMNDAMGLVGLLAGTVVATSAQRQMTSLNPKIVSGLEVVGGLMLKHHFPSPFMQGMGWGIAGGGTIGLAHEVGMIHGLDGICDSLFNRGGGQRQIPGGNQQVDIPQRRVNGGEMENVSGMNNFDTMSGDGIDGISNFDLMSGADSTLKQEYEEVQSLGM